MGLLTFLHLRRSDPWEPPTLLDSLLLSPLQYLLTHLYHLLLLLRGRPFRPLPSQPAIRVVALSDTHDHLIPACAMPPGDILIHAGDLTNDGTVASIQRQIDWLSGLPHAEKIVIGGNHDSWFDLASRREVDRGQAAKGVEWKGVRYLHNESVTVEFKGKGGRRLNIHGNGAVPRCGDDSNAFQYDRDKHPWKGRIPLETDLLVTHTPPRFHRDLALGCAGLLEEVWRVKPKLHIFGHAHWAHGREAVYFDECQRAYESLMARENVGPVRDWFPSAAWLDALAVLYYGITSVLWKWVMAGPGSNNGGLMVNVAVMYGNTGKLGNPVTVVDL